jgi:L-iditol 2-dehydrogenase
VGDRQPFFAHRLLDQRASLRPVGDQAVDPLDPTNAAHGALAEFALHAARRARIRLGETVAIFGLGPIGLMLAQWLKSMGASQIFLFDLLEGKLELARMLGFEQVYNSR